MWFKDLLLGIAEICIYILIIAFVVAIAYSFVQFIRERVFNRVPREKLIKERDALKEEVSALKAQVEKQQEQLMVQAAQHSMQAADRVPFVNIGALKVKSQYISYITTQSYENIDSSSDSRVKVIHYINTDAKDLVYSTFDAILEQLSGDFMMINKNVLINLGEVQKVQGGEVFLKNVKKSFFVSDHKKDEFDMRVVKV